VEVNIRMLGDQELLRRLEMIMNWKVWQGQDLISLSQAVIADATEFHPIGEGGSWRG